MKKLLMSVCAIFLIAFTVLNVYAAEYTEDVVVSLEIGNPYMTVNGVKAQIDGDRGTVPVVYNSRTLVPIRAIIEAFCGTVSWDEVTNTVTLTLDGDVIELTIGNITAYINDKPYMLDTAPDVINGRTMLPVRFVAEGFNLGVGWHDETQTVYIIRNGFDESEYTYLLSQLPEMSDEPYVVINNNEPMFKDYEIIPASFEYYSKLDTLGRCDVCMASVSPDTKPTAKRGSISSVKPTGWINKKYDCVPSGYLYNRCHLIGYQLTGENANKRNLITGTRYLNTEGMLPFENIVADYVDNTSNNVMYRVTPVFTDNNLLADGVLLEAYSVDDMGEAVSFCVYCYNVQPDIFIDYATGESSLMVK